MSYSIVHHNPDRSGNYGNDNDQSEQECQQIVAWFLFFLQMHEEQHLNQKLQNRCNHNNRDCRVAGHPALQHDNQRNDRQYNGQDKADYIGLD